MEELEQGQGQEGQAGGEGQPAGEPQGAPEGGEQYSGPTIPKPRFDEVYGNLKRYKEFGSADELKAKLQKLDQYEQAIEQHRQKQQPQNEDPKARIRQQLREVAPELDEISEMRETLHSIRMEKASTHLGSLLKEKVPGISLKMQDRIEDYVLANMTEEQSRRFNRGDLSVLNEFVEEDLETGLLGSLKSQTKAGNPPPKPPIRHGAGGTPPKPPGDQKPKTLKEAEDLAFARFAANKQE